MIEEILFELSNYLFLLWWGTLLFSNHNLIPIGHTIGFGIEGYIPKQGPIFEPAKGEVISIGLNGVKKCSGSFWGNLPVMPIPLAIYESYPGIFGFTGIKLRTRDYGCLFLGSALWVKIGNEPP